MTDETCCEFCLASTGPLLERSRPYDGLEGRELDLKAWTPYVRVVALDDGWIVFWQAIDDEPMLICPFHAGGYAVPRRPETLTIGGFTIDLQEFDYVGQRQETIMFRHVRTHRYLNIRPVGPTAVACDRASSGELFYRAVPEALRWVRNGQ